MAETGSKNRFVYSIVILLLVLSSIGIVLLYSHAKFTGLAIIDTYTTQETCEGAEYTWEVLTEQNCTTTTTCENTTIDCEPCLTYENLNGTQGDCIEWSSCINETCTDEETCVDVETGGQCTGDVCDVDHINLCTNESSCTTLGKYWYNDLCNEEPLPVCSVSNLTLCLDSVNCTAIGKYWYNEICNAGECVPQTCSDLSYTCGETSDGCGTILDCGKCSEGSTCRDGRCQQKSTGAKEQIPTTTVITTNAVSEEDNACTPNWECGEWQKCIDSQQVRVCTDLNDCGSSDEMPTTLQKCIMPETCFDGIKNQDETQVDCGGSICKKCSFFSLVGNSVSDMGKKLFVEGMFGSIPKTIITITILVLLVGGFIVARLFLIKKHINLQDKIQDLIGSIKKKLFKKSGASLND